jgi:PilZ domain
MNRCRDRERERRREDRVGHSGLRARMRPGYRLIVIDVSTCGALVEAGRPLRPGSYVELHLETDAQRATIAARVVRCTVAAIHSESGVTYRAALSFREACEWVREGVTPGGYGLHALTAGADSPAASRVDDIPATRDARAIAARTDQK